MQAVQQTTERERERERERKRKKEKGTETREREGLNGLCLKERGKTAAHLLNERGACEQGAHIQTESNGAQCIYLTQREREGEREDGSNERGFVCSSPHNRLALPPIPVSSLSLLSLSQPQIALHRQTHSSPPPAVGSSEKRREREGRRACQLRHRFTLDCLPLSPRLPLSPSLPLPLTPNTPDLLLNLSSVVSACSSSDCSASTLLPVASGTLARPSRARNTPSSCSTSPRSCSASGPSAGAADVADVAPGRPAAMVRPQARLRL